MRVSPISRHVFTFALLGNAASLGAGCATLGKTPPREVPVEAARDADGCGDCHAEIAREWSASMHHQSFTDPFFRESYEGESRAFCVACHAPGASARDGDSWSSIRAQAPFVTARGIGCTSCHGSGPPKTARADDTGAAPHPITRDPSFATRAACAPCHEFLQPGARDPLQTTLSEHAASEFASASCASCHMDRSRGHTDHTFRAGVRNERALRAAIEIVVTARDEWHVDVILRSVGVGHAFPTGDLFRRLRLEIDALDAEGRTDDRHEWFFGRTFVENGATRADTHDRRVHGERQEALQIPFALGKDARYRLYYDRVLAERAGRAVIGDSVLLAEGRVR